MFPLVVKAVTRSCPCSFTSVAFDTMQCEISSQADSAVRIVTEKTLVQAYRLDADLLFKTYE
eukprot:23105-Eustigmatos_ZCMA.PRE.1